MGGAAAAICMSKETMVYLGLALGARLDGLPIKSNDRSTHYWFVEDAYGNHIARGGLKRKGRMLLSRSTVFVYEEHRSESQERTPLTWDHPCGWCFEPKIVGTKHLRDLELPTLANMIDDLEVREGENSTPEEPK